MSIYSTYSKIVKPNKMDSSVDGNVGKFVVYPIQRGYGVTLANSLRRVLLSSIRGTVISSVKIEGVSHEFSSIPAVKQDVIKICLNLRKVAIKSEKENSSASIDVKGPMVVTAGMIKTEAGVEIVNKDLVLFEIESDESVSMSLKITSGIGSAFAETNSEEQVIGEILLDCYFSPVKNVSFSTDVARVDRFTDFDKLTMNIETNGTIAPDEAFSVAAGILRDFLKVFTNIGDEEFSMTQSVVKKKQESDYNLNLLKKTEDVELSVRSANCLTNAGIKYIGDLVQKTEGEMLKMPNFGRKSLDELREILTKMGLCFGADIGVWPPKDMSKLVAMAEKYFEEE